MNATAMNATMKLRVDDNAKVLTAGAEDRAVLPVQVDVQHNDAGALVLALEKLPVRAARRQ